MTGRNYLVQWYTEEVQNRCIYLHGNSEIEKLGNGKNAATRLGQPSFSEEIRKGFQRLTIHSQWAQESGEEERTTSSPKRRFRESNKVQESPSNSQSQMDELHEGLEVEGTPKQSHKNERKIRRKGASGSQEDSQSQEGGW